MRRSVVLWLFLLLLVASASAWMSAQATIVRPPDQSFVLSGSDVGVRVEARDGNTAIGKLVVRIDGRWVELVPSGGMYRLAK